MKKLLACAVVIAMLLPACLAQTGTLRALSVGIADYDNGRARTGGINSTQGIYDALSRAFGVNGSFESRLALDTSKDELLSLIEGAFQEARDDDVSLIYINAHGGAQAGISWIETREGARLTPFELERATRPISGKVILLIDCCASGGFIGFTQSFGQNVFAADKYLVLVSCALEENSYRVASRGLDERNISTVFARCVCEAIGWDLINDRSTSLKADIDRDRRVSFQELSLYTARRARYYLSTSPGSVQSVTAEPEACAFIIASRIGPEP